MRDYNAFPLPRRSGTLDAVRVEPHMVLARRKSVRRGTRPGLEEPCKVEHNHLPTLRKPKVLPYYQSDPTPRTG